MDYIDQVYIKVKDLPKGKYPMADLQDPDHFIDAIQHLIDGEWINDIDFTTDHQKLVKHDFTGFKTITHK